MLDEVYQGKFAWVLTPDAQLAKSIKNIGLRFPGPTMIANDRPCLYLSGGEMRIDKSKVMQFCQSLKELKDSTISCRLNKVGTRMGFLVWTCDKLPDTIKALIASTEVFLQPHVTDLHFKPLSGSIVISRLQKNKSIETFEHQETFFAEHLQFVELDDNLFNKRAKFQVF